MRRTILVLALLAIMAVPAVAQSGYDDDYGKGYDDYGRDYDDNDDYGRDYDDSGYYDDDYDDRGYDEDPRDPDCGWYPNWDDEKNGGSTGASGLTGGGSSSCGLGSLTTA